MHMLRKFLITPLVTGLVLSMLIGDLIPFSAAAQVLPDPVRTSYSVFPSRPPTINGQISPNEWADALVYNLPHGTVSILNDAINVYFLFNMTADTDATGLDYFWLAFDANLDGAITPNVDVLYSPLSSTQLCRQSFLGPDSWSVCKPTDSQVSVGFGGAINATPNHRIYEVAISQAELNTAPGGQLRIGVRVYSAAPSFKDEMPVNLSSDMSSYALFSLDKHEVLLLILAHPEFLDALQTLKNHKDYTDMPAYVQSWTDLNASLRSLGWDTPERIKQGIVRYQKYSQTQYVLLVGDADHFPMRYTITDRADTAAFNRAYYATDLYYADLYESATTTFESWDANHDHYYGELHGETYTGVVNVDQVDLIPDVSVGRIPADTVAEVTNYISKVIAYENNAYKSAWTSHALEIASHDWVHDACSTAQTIAADYLTGFNNRKLFESGNPCAVTDPPSSANILADLNDGARYAVYVGHGGPEGWAIPGDWFEYGDLAGLTNASTPAIVFSAGCSTSRYTTEPPYSPYTDVSGVHHIGTVAGEIFTTVPPIPDALQVADNPRTFGEAMTVESLTGAVAYLGFSTGSQPPAIDLARLFYESLDYGATTLGHMWRYMIYHYYQLHPIPASLGSPDWVVVATAHQPWKLPLFGDPSLRINGISHFQKSDFASTYEMNHDGWPGTLSLAPVRGSYIENIPNMSGWYSGVTGLVSASGLVRSWDYPIPEAGWPDHKIRLRIDFANTPLNYSDDQNFDAYLFSQTRSMMAGITWWNSTPFGFYARKMPNVTSNDPFDLSGWGALQYEIYTPGSVAFTKADFSGFYDLSYDGWKAILKLYAVPDNFAAHSPNLLGELTWPNGVRRSVYGYVRTPTYPLDVSFGPDHTILFYVDFPNTPANTADDQSFTGYLFTQTKSAIAGTTDYHGTNFGFAAIKQKAVYIPLLKK